MLTSTVCKGAMLEGTNSSPQLDVEVAKDQKPNKKKTHKFWLVATFEFEHIDGIKGYVELKVWTKWYWRSENKLEVVRSGDRKIFKHEVESSDCFPVNPSHPFANWIHLDEVKHLSRAESDHAPSLVTGDPPYFNFAQKVYQAKLQTKLNMTRYPFDRHLVPVILALRSWKGDTPGRWELMTVFREEWLTQRWFPEGQKLYSEDKTVGHVKDYWEYYREELRQAGPGLEPLVELLPGTNKPVIYLKLQRDPLPAIFYISLPAFIVVSIVLMTLILPFDETEGAEGDATTYPVDYMQAVGTGLLTLTASQMAMFNKMPDSTSVTIADKYMLLSYFFLFFLGVQMVVAAYTKAWTVDTGIIIIGAFGCFWLLLHLVILLEYTRRYQLCSRLFQQPWEKVKRPEERWT